MTGNFLHICHLWQWKWIEVQKQWSLMMGIEDESLKMEFEDGVWIRRLKFIRGTCVTYSLEVDDDGWWLTAAMVTGWLLTAENVNWLEIWWRIQESKWNYSKTKWSLKFNFWLSQTLEIWNCCHQWRENHWKRTARKGTRLWSHQRLSSVVHVLFEMRLLWGNIKFCNVVDWWWCWITEFFRFSCK